MLFLLPNTLIIWFVDLFVIRTNKHEQDEVQLDMSLFLIIHSWFLKRP